MNRLTNLSKGATSVFLVAAVASALGASAPQSAYAGNMAADANANFVPVAFNESTAKTGIQVQNVDPSQGATISADFYRVGGGWERKIDLPLTPPGAAASLYLPGTPLPAGTYSVVLNSDRPIATIARTDWPGSGGAAITSNVIPGSNIALPLAVRDYYGQSSVVAIQNTGMGAPARTTVELFRSGAAAPTISKAYSIPAGTAITLDLVRDPEFGTLGAFLGSLMVTSDTEVGVQSFVHIARAESGHSPRGAVYAFEGVPAEMASPTLYSPLFRARQYPRPDDRSSGRFDTAIAVVNPGVTSVDVTITYYGQGGTCAGETVTSPPATIAPNSNHVFWQGDPASQGLKENCYGSAVIQSSGSGILAIVNDAQNLNQTAAAYNAVTAAQGKTTVALPLVRKNHANGLTTGISAMNVGTGQAQTYVSYALGNPSGGSPAVPCDASCAQTVSANQTAIFWPGNISAIPDNWYGTATVHSSQPVVAIVNDVNIWGAIDSATYGGIKVDAP